MIYNGQEEEKITKLGEVLRLLLDFLEALTDRVGLHADLEDGIAHTGLVQEVIDRHGGVDVELTVFSVTVDFRGGKKFGKIRFERVAKTFLLSLPSSRPFALSQGRRFVGLRLRVADAAAAIIINSVQSSCQLNLAIHHRSCNCCVTRALVRF
jgi:hypothetical protein